MSVNHTVEAMLDWSAGEVGRALDANVIAIIGPIYGDLDRKVREAVGAIIPESKKPRAAIVLDTVGGVVEIVERMVMVLRHHFQEIHVIVPDKAMSAGTIFAMSADTIWMDYFSCLGPIDPQIERGGKLVPALSYVVQYDELNQKSARGEPLTDPEMMLISKLDLADLHTYRQARELSIRLLEDWLSRYKFKDWTVTATRKDPIDDAKRRERAKQIATQLSDNTLWKSHGRPISMSVLRDTLNLRINDLGENQELATHVASYFGLLYDYAAGTSREQAVHTTGVLI